MKMAAALGPNLLPEPNTSGTSWTSMRWPSGGRSSGTSNVGYTKSRLLAAAAQTTGRPMNHSPTKLGAGISTAKLEDKQPFANLRTRLGDAVSRTTAPIMLFTNKMASNKRSDSSFIRDEPKDTQPARQVVRGTVTKMQIRSSEPTKSAAMDEYAKALTRRKQAIQNDSHSTTVNSTPDPKARLPDVFLSRFGSRSPAFLAGGVVRSVPITLTHQKPETQPTLVMNKPIPKAERPWRQRLADSARLRNLEEEAHQHQIQPATITKGPPLTISVDRRQVVSASTPTSSIALRNYESKFQNRKYTLSTETPSSRPTSFVMPSSVSPSAYLVSKYKPRNSLTGEQNISQLARNSSSASPQMSLLSAMPSTATSRFRTTGGSSASPVNYTPQILNRYTPGVPSGRRLSTNIMSRSYTPSYTPTTSRLTVSTAYNNYGNYRSRLRDEETSWKPVEHPPQVYDRRSRRDRSSSATRKRRSRSKTNEPPPPASSSDSEKETAYEDERIPPRARRLKRKPNISGSAQNNKKDQTDKPMPAAVRQFETATTDEVRSVAVLPDVSSSNKGMTATDIMESSAHSTITNASESLADEPVDESKYNAVTNFRPAGLRVKRQKSPRQKPVPGIWPLNAANEINISQNKTFRRLSDHIIVEITMKHFPYARASTAHFRMPRPRKQALMFKLSPQKPAAIIQPKIESKTISASFMRPKFQNLGSTVTIWSKKPTISTAISSKLKEPRQTKPRLKEVETTVNKILINKKSSKMRIDSVWKSKEISQHNAQLKCKSSAIDRGKLLNLNIQRKPETRACNGTVKDDKDVVFAKVESGVCVAPVSVKVTLAQPPKIFSPTNAYDGFSSSPEPYEPKLHVPLGNNHQGGPLILPDRSVLEEYVKRKRTHLENLHRQHLVSGDNSFAESPSPSLQPATTATELQIACPVRILEPHIQQALITTPTRSRVSSVEPASSGHEQSMTPRPNEAGCTLAAPIRSGGGLLAQPSPTTLSQNSHRQQQLQPNQGAQQQPVAANFFRGVLRKTSDPTGGSRLKPGNIFDTPKSPFEERMQQQANQLRKTSVGSSDTDNEAPAKTKTSIDGGIVQGFTAALAQQPVRHERYAAHIPVSSGRQSVTSMESVNSGALDTASRQLDQMIDQARYKHQQHRTKFKEAIDYLDQIFEDLKKECEPASPPTKLADPNTPQFQSPQQQLKPKPFPVGSQQEQRFQKSVSQDPAPEKISSGPPQKPFTTHARVIQPQPPPHQQRLQSNQQQNNHRPMLRKQRSNIEGNNNRDIEVSETIVLPSKQTAERLDFTRQWLKNDIRAWVNRPNEGKVDNMPDQNIILRQNSSGADSDEHSLGSCSAEVAAINIQSTQKHQKLHDSKQTVIKKPAPNTSNIQTQQESQKTSNSGPLKPRAYRPQPQNGVSSNKNLPILNAPDKPLPFNELQKVPSQQDIPRPPTQDSLDRAEDYQSLGSSHSQEGYRPPQVHSNSLQRSVSGAFVQYPQRGSIQSLPDAVLVTGAPQQRIGGLGSSATLQPNVYLIPTNQPHPHQQLSGLVHPNQNQQTLPPPDPAVQALMAELDIPPVTTNIRPFDEMSPEDPEEKRRSFPTTQNDVMRLGGKIQPVVQRPIPTRLNVPQQPQGYTGSMDRGMAKIHQQPIHNPFTNKVLGPQKSPPPPDPNRKQFEDASNLLDSVIDELKPKPRSPTSQAKRQQLFRQQHQFSQQLNQSFVSPSARIGGSNAVNLQAPTIRQGQQRIVQPLHRGSSAKEPEATYSEIGEFQQEPQFNRAPSFKGQSNINRPAFPLSQPPPPQYIPTQQQPAINIQRVSSGVQRPAFGEAVGGRPVSNNYDTNSSDFHGEDDEEGGFYDNIQTLQNREEQKVPGRTLTLHGARFGQSIPMPIQAVPPQVPPHKFLPQQKSAGARIGQLIRKLGGVVAERPIVHQVPSSHHLRVERSPSTGSVLSLNRISHDNQPRRTGMLVKSNSLSHEPWRIYAMNNDLSNSATHQNNDSSKTGFGNRIKQTIFGSKKWLNS